MKSLKDSDPEIYNIIQREKERQMNGLELIPSENLVSTAVLEAMGSILTNKYSEGYPHKRYYGGNIFIDQAEDLAIERAKQLFGAEHVNVQPLSGSPANMAVFFALMNPGDKFLGMDLSCGGHLTHGSPVSFSGKLYKCAPYFVDKETELIDYDAVRKLALAEKPKMIMSGFSAYPRTLDFSEFQKIADEVEAYHVADVAHIAGLIAAGIHDNPVKYCDVVTTTTHKTLRGPRGAIIMSKIDDRYHDKYRKEEKKNLAQMIDFNVFPGTQGGPHDHINAAKAVCFKEALQPEFKDYAKQIVKNAKTLSEGLMDHGFRLITNGTDNHLMLIDMTNKNITGKEAETVLDEVSITVNKNTIPYDQRKPWDPSGIRLGTPLLTTRGMCESEMKSVAEYIAKAIDHRNDSTIKEKIRQDVLQLCKKFVFYS
ncbi:MAG: serine hydroxymethyltransferase [Candidatus Aenigmarchaeota archaeon]|nr:serine hydroxymethyltransferase [Candidatus Aenigmarchaeota archaeon]